MFVHALIQADLVDTLNSAEGVTVFVPINTAWDQLDEASLTALLADKETLTQVLSHLVIAERIDAFDLAGAHKTLEGDTLTVAGTNPDFDVDQGTAWVVCSGIQTANATVYLIDSVLTPTG